MDTCIMADSKQETTRVAGTKVDICFDSVEVRQTFVSVINSKGNRRGRLEIIKVDNNGYFEGQIKCTDDKTEGQASLVVGNLKPNGEADHTNGNKSVQQQLPIIKETEVNNTESVTLQPEKSHGPDDVNMLGEMMIDHSVFSSNLDEPNVAVIPLSQSSHIQLPTTKSRHSSASISTGICEDQAGSGATQDGANRVCRTCQYEDEGVLIFSKFRKEKIGTICKEYIGLKEGIIELGKGGFGKVYQYEEPDTGQLLAIKVEERRPLTEYNAELFQKIKILEHPNVIQMLEYLTGPVNKDGKRLYLFVMPLMNKRDLDKQFDICKCILDYMDKYQGIQKFIFRNYLVLFCQVFDALQYLKEQQIVHRDIKSSNILVHQKCKCQNAMLCICPNNQTKYVVGDLDLLCFEGQSSATNFEDWIMTEHNPAGTIEMKPPEAFYNSGKGEPVIDHRSDVWSGSVTMMNVLGKGVKWEPRDQLQIKKFLKVTTCTIRTVSDNIASSCKMLDNLVAKKSSLPNELESSEIIRAMCADFKILKKLLDESNDSLRKIHSFQGVLPGVYKEECPLAGILSTVYVAKSLHWVCLDSFPVFMERHCGVV